MILIAGELSPEVLCLILVLFIRIVTVKVIVVAAAKAAIMASAILVKPSIDLNCITLGWITPI